MEKKVISANACYTGGGIYIYYGKFSDGTHFLSDNDYRYVSVFDVDASNFDESLMSDWQETHCIECLSDEDKETDANRIKTLTDILGWILINKPDGNYDSADIENEYEDLTGEKFHCDKILRSKVRIEYEDAYSTDHDITFILRRVYKGEQLMETEITGFYHGEPNEAESFECRHNGTKARYY